MKICSKCEESKLETEFYPDKNGDKGLKFIEDLRKTPPFRAGMQSKSAEVSAAHLKTAAPLRMLSAALGESPFLQDGEDIKCKSCENKSRTDRRKEALVKMRELAEDAGIRLIEVAEDTPDSAKYDASCIKVLSVSEAYKRMPWLKADELASRYGKDAGFVSRGLEACRRAGVGEEYFVKRYLEGMKDIPFDEAVDYQSRVLQGLIAEQ